MPEGWRLAACKLLRGHAGLGDHAVGLGYADRLLAVLMPCLKAASAGAVLPDPHIAVSS